MKAVATLIAILGGSMYMGGSLTNRPRLALAGLILLDLESAAAAGILLYFHEYFLAGC